MSNGDCVKHGLFDPWTAPYDGCTIYCPKCYEEKKVVHCMKHGAYDERLNLCPECPETPRWKANEVNFQAEALMASPVVAPPHYRFGGGLQTIDLIYEVLSKQQDGFVAYCLGNVFKYLTRYGRKDGLQDLKKAQQYLNWMVEHIEKGKITHA